MPQPKFEKRPDKERPWIWEVWDIDHPEPCNHFRIAVIDSNGASEDFHESYADAFLDGLNRRFNV